VAQKRKKFRRMLLLDLATAFAENEAARACAVSAHPRNQIRLRLDMLLDGDNLPKPGTYHLARMLGVTPRTIQRWRAGKRYPSEKERRVLLEAFVQMRARLGVSWWAKWRKRGVAKTLPPSNPPGRLPSSMPKLEFYAGNDPKPRLTLRYTRPGPDFPPAPRARARRRKGRPLTQ
jgi:hypothetical protein